MLRGHGTRTLVYQMPCLRGNSQGHASILLQMRQRWPKVRPKAPYAWEVGKLEERLTTRPSVLEISEQQAERLQFNLNHCRAAQDLLAQTVFELKCKHSATPTRQSMKVHSNKARIVVPRSAAASIPLNNYRKVPPGRDTAERSSMV